MERFLFVTMRFIYLVLLSVLSCHLAFAQELPSKIRGYPVHKTPIVVADTLAANESTDTPAVVKLGEPDVTDVSLTGVTFELQGEITSLTQSGKVDFLTFHDFEVNGIPRPDRRVCIPFHIPQKRTCGSSDAGDGVPSDFDHPQSRLAGDAGIAKRVDRNGPRFCLR